MMKPLNIGFIGYGFMGRTHSNAFSKVNNFFDLPYRPVLKAVCARNEKKVKAFAAKWGYETWETDWRKFITRDDIDVSTSPAPTIPTADRRRRRQAGKMILCEKPLSDGDRRPEDGAGHRESRRAEHGLV